MRYKHCMNKKHVADYGYGLDEASGLDMYVV